MTTIYIDPLFGAGGDGTEATPYDDWSDVTWVDGNIYLQKCGTVAQLTSPLSPTTNNFTIGSYGFGPRPIVEVVVGSQTSVIEIVNRTGFTIKDLEIRWDGTNALTTSGIRLNSSSPTNVNALISNLWISSTGNGSSTTKGLTSQYCNYMTITDCLIENSDADAIYIDQCNYVNISNNRLLKFDLGITAGDGIQVNGDCSYCTISGNYIVFDSGGPKGCIVSSGTSTYGGNIYENNQMYGGNWGISCGDKNSIVRNNFVFEPLAFGISVGEDSLIYNNIVVALVDTTVEAVRYNSNMDVANTEYNVQNNVFYMNGSVSTSRSFGPEGSYTLLNNPKIIFKNNICKHIGVSGRYFVAYGTTIIEMDNNIYYGMTVTPRWTLPSGNNNSLSDQQTDGYDLNSYEGIDPKLDSNHRPMVTSIAIGNGNMSLSAIDFDGNYRKTLSNDIGAKWFDRHEDSTVNMLLASGGVV